MWNIYNIKDNKLNINNRNTSLAILWMLKEKDLNIFYNTGVPVSILVPLPAPPLRDSLSVLIQYFKSTDKWVDLGIGNEDSTICTSIVKDWPSELIHYPYWFTIRTDSLSVLIHYPYWFTIRTDSLSILIHYPYFKRADKWVDLAILGHQSAEKIVLRHLWTTPN